MSEMTETVGADWDDLAAVCDVTGSLFRHLVAPGVLDGLLDNLVVNERLRHMCERYDFLDKLVLFDDQPTGVRVRLHLFREGYFDRPHNHRWSFASRIVTGQYTHRLYGREDVLLQADGGAIMTPIMERIERPGDEYVLHHDSVHAVQAEQDTISLVLRGPARKDRFLIVDKSEDRSFWVEGAALESPAKRAEKVMSAETLDSVVEHVRQVLARSPGSPAVR